MMTPVLVLRSGGDFEVQHANTLAAAINEIGGLSERVVVLTDMPEESFVGCSVRPLRHRFPGWWSKMELFAPWNDGLGDILYIDLDTVIVGKLYDLADVDRLVLLHDFYRTKTLASGVMYLPVESRLEVWAPWIADSIGCMQRFVRYGDGQLLNELWHEPAEQDDALLSTAATWQALLPGQVVSFKVHVRAHGFIGEDRIPEGARVVCYHGRPRPWASNRPTTQEMIQRTSSMYYRGGGEYDHQV